MHLRRFWRRDSEDRERMRETQEKLDEAKQIEAEAEEINRRHRFIVEQNHLGPTIARALRGKESA